MIRNLLRFLGLLLMTSLFLATGMSCLLHPNATVAYLEENSLLFIFRDFGPGFVDPPSGPILEVIVRVFGGLVVFFVACVLLGVYRRFFALLLAVVYAVVLSIDLCLQVSSTASLSHYQKMEILKALSIVGGFLFVVGSGRGSRYKRAKEIYEAEKKRQ